MAGRNVVLIGSMGAGKSTIGARLAERLGYMLVDTDALVEQAAGETIAEIWARDGEEGFRRREHEAVLKACAGSKRVIACGGGSILQLTNFGVLKGAGTIVYLRAPADALWERIATSNTRPLVRDRAAFAKLLVERTPVYESAADHILDVDDRSPDEIADQIAGLVS
jgi:shikimate kinase